MPCASVPTSIVLSSSPSPLCPSPKAAAGSTASARAPSATSSPVPPCTRVAGATSTMAVAVVVPLSAAIGPARTVGSLSPSVPISSSAATSVAAAPA
eukprot:5290813-Prymnesium_polylepis.1